VSAEPNRDRDRETLFGEEVGGDPPLPALLADAQRHLAALAERYGEGLPVEERFEVLDQALDELDAALERVRDARAKLTRIEVRLAAAYENAVARIRQTERDG
jgi:phage shock protein A